MLFEPQVVSTWNIVFKHMNAQIAVIKQMNIAAGIILKDL